MKDRLCQNGPEDTARSQEDRIRRLLLGSAVIVTVLALTHHADHVIRGELVSDHGLDAKWNHSGWPFRSSVTPFTFSLAVYVILVPGIVATLRRRAWADYWIVASVVLAAVIVVVHFLPGPHTETPGVIYDTYERSSGPALAGALAVADVVVVLIALGALFVLAVRARRISGRW